MSVKVMGRVWDLQLTPAKQMVLLALADHAAHDGSAVKPGVPLIAWKTGYSERQVQRIMKDLEKDELLVKVQEVRGKPTIYRIDLTKGVQKPLFKTRDERQDDDDKMSSEDDQIQDDVVDYTKGDILSPLTSQGKDDAQGGDIASANLTRIHQSTDPSLKDPAPENGAVTQLKVVKPRKRNPLYDAVELHIFEITESTEEEVGRIVKIANWLAGKYEGKGKEKMGKISSPAEPSHVKLFAEYCTHKGISPPLDFVKFVENWRKWASGLKQKALAPAWQPVVAPAATVTPALSADERAAMLEQTRARRGALLGQMSTNADMSEAS